MKTSDSVEPVLDPSRGASDDSRPFGVYVHFPFCGSRCPYCDFAVAVRPTIPHDEYADAVLSELSARAPWWKGGSREYRQALPDGTHRGSSKEPSQGSFFNSPRECWRALPDGTHRGSSKEPSQGSFSPRLVSIYFGGGTPGLWRAEALGRVLLGARQAFAGGHGLEITVEANPGDLDTENLRELHERGVNRLSFGAQAFQDHLLRRIGRRHEAAAIPRAFAAARAAGFDNLCTDLMFGLPEQTMDDWRASLAALRALGPEHITAYALTVEPGTRFGALERAGKLDRPGDDLVAAMYSVCHDTLTAAGYEHYEISSYAKPGRRSVHNSLYWTMGSYLGLGVSASSFRPLASGDGWRFSNPRSVGTYLRAVHASGGAIAPEQVELRSPAQLEDEALWLGLRMSDGVDRHGHAQFYGQDPLALLERKAAAQACAAAGWLEVTAEHLRLTPAGFLFADEVAVRLGRRA